MPIIADYVPRPDTSAKGVWTGGSVAYFERKLKELEDQKPQSLKETPKGLRERKGFKQEQNKQTSISSFFTKIKPEVKKEKDDDATSETHEELLTVKEEPKDAAEDEPMPSEGELEQLHENLETVKKEPKTEDADELQGEEEQQQQQDEEKTQLALEFGDRKYKLLANGDGSYDIHRKTRVSHLEHEKEKKPAKPSTSKFNFALTKTVEKQEKEKASDEEEVETPEEAVETPFSTEPIGFTTARQMLEEKSLNKRSIKEEKEPQKETTLGGFKTARQMLEEKKVQPDVQKTTGDKERQKKENDKSERSKEKSNADRNTEKTRSGCSKEKDTSQSASSKEKPAKISQQKNDVSKSVVQLLNPYYKRKIATKELFKALAKLITQRICDGSLGKFQIGLIIK